MTDQGETVIQTSRGQGRAPVVALGCHSADLPRGQCDTDGWRVEDRSPFSMFARNSVDFQVVVDIWRASRRLEPSKSKYPTPKLQRVKRAGAGSDDFMSVLFRRLQVGGLCFNKNPLSRGEQFQDLCLPVPSKYLVQYGLYGIMHTVRALRTIDLRASTVRITEHSMNPKKPTSPPAHLPD